MKPYNAYLDRCPPWISSEWTARIPSMRPRVRFAGIDWLHFWRGPKSSPPSALCICECPTISPKWMTYEEKCIWVWGKAKERISVIIRVVVNNMPNSRPRSSSSSCLSVHTDDYPMKRSRDRSQETSFYGRKNCDFPGRPWSFLTKAAAVVLSRQLLVLAYLDDCCGLSKAELCHDRLRRSR